MSDEDNFIARWSRLKAANQKAQDKGPRADRPTAGQRSPDAPDGPRSAAPDKACAKTVKTEVPFDPASLPSIESIVAGTDIRAFLQSGVPAELTKAALRRAWTTDPAIRDFIGIAENQWDFTDPTAIPGFGPLEASDRLGELVSQAMGKLPDLPDPVGPRDDDRSAVASAAADEPPQPDQEASEDPDASQAAALQHPAPQEDVGTSPRRKGHGRALPR